MTQDQANWVVAVTLFVAFGFSILGMVLLGKWVAHKLEPTVLAAHDHPHEHPAHEHPQPVAEHKHVFPEHSHVWPDHSHHISGETTR